MKRQEGELRLFGVQISSPPPASENEALMMRKCLSLGNLQHYSGNLSPLSSGSGTGSSSGFPAPCEHWDADGYGSDGFPSSLPLSRDRKKGVPWSEEEHRLFLIGLQKLGKGDWRGIARNFVRTRTPTQVASHAQKFFLRQTNMNKRRRRSSLFDISFEDSASAASAAKLMRLDPQTPQLSSCFNGGKLSLRTGFVSECNDFSVVTTDLSEARARKDSLLQPLTIWPESGSPSLLKSQAAGVESCCSTQLSLGHHRLNSFPDHTGVEITLKKI